MKRRPAKGGKLNTSQAGSVAVSRAAVGQFLSIFREAFILRTRYSHSGCIFYWSLMLSNRKWRKNTVVLVLVSPLLSVGMAERVPFILKSPCGWVAVVTSLALSPQRRLISWSLNLGDSRSIFLRKLLSEPADSSPSTRCTTGTQRGTCSDDKIVII